MFIMFKLIIIYGFVMLLCRYMKGIPHRCQPWMYCGGGAAFGPCYW
jgi:hypothetical protein